mmetsp:Transcript_32528/g.76598  ORF Transcript_32528/g.76598 Transcript_32528/m.76598 type:complete len:240 (-) Transcript_32528:29-748(-)
MFCPPFAICFNTSGGSEISILIGWPAVALLIFTGTVSNAELLLGETVNVGGSSSFKSSDPNSSGDETVEGLQSTPRGVVALDAVASPASLDDSKSADPGEFSSDPIAQSTPSSSPSSRPSSVKLDPSELAPECSSFLSFLSMLFTFLYGQRWMPFWRQIFLSEVRQIPRCFATAFSGIVKYCWSSSMSMARVSGILVFWLREAVVRVSVTPSVFLCNAGDPPVMAKSGGGRGRAPSQEI